MEYPNEVYTKELLVYQMGSQPILSGNKKGGYLPKKFNKICFCPHCFGTIFLGRNSDRGKWKRNRRHYVPDKFKLKCKDEEEFFMHIRCCPLPILDKGVNRIDKTSNLKKCLLEKACEMVDFFSLASYWEACEYSPQEERRVRAENLLNGDHIAYVFVDEYGPTSFAVFRTARIKNVGEVLMLDDIFTFKPFRNQGYATQIVKYAIKDLNLDKSFFNYHGPLTHEMNRIFDKLGIVNKKYCISGFYH